MFPNGLIIYFRLMATPTSMACSIFQKGRSIHFNDSSGFVTILDEDKTEIGLCAEDFISAILPIPEASDVDQSKSS